jgi:uncharacterized membrane protein
MPAPTGDLVSDTTHALTPEEREQRAEQLRERIYITFAALAVVIALDNHGVGAAEALGTLVVTVLGTLLAVFVADVISHIVVQERMLTRPEMRHAVITSFGALTAVILPAVFLILAIVGVWSTDAALRVSSIALVAALVVIGYTAIRRIRVTWWKRLLALGAEALLGLVVVGLQVLAKGG